MTAHGTSRTIGSWGGRRKGAGRKPKLTLSSRQKIAREYLDHMLEPREFGDTPRRDALIRKLMAKYNVTHRMVVRCLDEWLPTRWNRKMYRFATEGATIQRLSEEKIEKLSPGIYEDKNLPLRLIIGSDGSRKWIFRFKWRFTIHDTIHDMVLGDHPEISLTRARDLASKASRKLAAGQNPIDGSWANAALQSAKSKT
jgi:hypothetical protein